MASLATDLYDFSHFMIASSIGIFSGAIMELLWSKLKLNTTSTSPVKHIFNMIIGISEVAITIKLIQSLVEIVWVPGEFDAELYLIMSIVMSIWTTQSTAFNLIKNGQKTFFL